MKWFLVVSLLLGFAKLSVGIALRSTSTQNDESQNTTSSESVPDAIKQEETQSALKHRWTEECLAGSEWESNCHYCRCSDKGRAVCTRQRNCDDSHDEPIRCKPQSEFKRDCNTCRCLDNGLRLCTMRGCSKSPVAENLEVSEKECSPGSRWMNKCNQCECSATGVSQCTIKECPGMENEPEAKCAPNSTWQSDCNTCWCFEGRVQCTKKGCSQHIALDWNPPPTKATDTTNDLEREETKDNQIHRIKKRSRCEPNTTFQKDCNTCVCSADGQNYACTLKFCLNDSDEISSRKKRDTSHKVKKRSICKPNSQFRIYCNDCACAPDGQSYSCTAKDCADDPSFEDAVEVFKEEEGPEQIERHSVCKPRGIFYMGCNTCKCNFDGSNYACTNKPCPLPDDVEIFHELKEISKTRSSLNSTKAVICAANRMFIRDCNTCWCNDDGTSFICTRKACIHIPDEERKKDPKSKSKSNESTIKEETLKQQCRPDEVFEMDCNTCRCNSDGTGYSCTRKACFPEELKSPGKTTPPRVEEPILDFRIKRSSAQQKSNPGETTPSRPTPNLKKACQPGQEFRMDCNKCLCDNEGQNFSCTRIDCAAVNNGNGGERTKREVTSQNQTDCAPGSVFEQGCNVCRCTSDGNHATCTMKICQETSDNDINVPESDPSFRCNPGEQFKRGCKDCTCSADGKSVFCTLRLCDQDINPSM